ncbi:GTP-binding [Cyclospora cayetanensis]|uniref:GTP-binding n=1 Tax=Cyclospora cayetanensis TaxID=88456 RepID=A0A1D3CVN3_9EIME|nr:GTP-binding [Cyclospora cayetanensis]
MRLSLVDLPGYGFAKVPAEMKKDWALLLEQYLERSTQLRRVVCLVDASAGVRTLDLSLWSLLLEKNKPFLVVVTKADLLTTFELHGFMLRLQQRLLLLLQQQPPQQRSVLQPFVFAVSAKRSLGLTALRCYLTSEASTFEKRTQ